MRKCFLFVLGFIAFVGAFAQQTNSLAANNNSMGAVKSNLLENKLENYNKLVYEAFYNPNAIKGNTSIANVAPLTTLNVALSEVKNTTDSNLEKTEKSNNCCIVKYSLSGNNKFKYKLHIQGKVKDCSNQRAIAHAYVSVNSAVDPNRFAIIPTGADGEFQTDVTDDSISGITIFKNGYAEKQVSLAGAMAVSENSSYAFDVCLEKVKSNDEPTTNHITNKTPTSNNIEYSASKQIGEVRFDYNKSKLSKESTEMLDSVISQLKDYAGKPAVIEINGHTDSKGSKQYNEQLSKARSLACKAYITSHGVKNFVLKINAYGSQFPIENEKVDGIKDNPNARAKNRRVEIIVRLIKHLA